MVLSKLFAHSYIHTCIHTYVHFEGIASCIFLFDLHSLSHSTWRCHMVFFGKTTCSYSHAKVVYLYFNYFVYITTRICRVFGHQQNFLKCNLQTKNVRELCYDFSVWQCRTNGAQMWWTGTLLALFPSVISVFTIFTLEKKVRCSHDTSIGRQALVFGVCVGAYVFVKWMTLWLGHSYIRQQRR